MIENYRLPKKKEERLERLNQALSNLKKEFVGLDEIIDRIGDSIRIWYLTPEILNRPTVISLWGMTGTGKTSVAKRLVEELGILGSTVFLDCGQESREDGNRTVMDTLSDLLTEDDNLVNDSSNKVFVLDEFQYARTINESGTELIKSPLRPLWSLIDSGLLTLDAGSWRYAVGEVGVFIEDLKNFCNLNAGKSVCCEVGKLKNGKISDETAIKELFESLLGVLYYKDYTFDLDESPRSPEVSEVVKKRQESITIFPANLKKALIRKLDSVGGAGLGMKVWNELGAATSIPEFCDILSAYQSMIVSPKILHFERSLIFIIGNLDEAFKGVERLTNPDFDADVFREITSSVTEMDIKMALQQRFRAEQIGRFGNNIIKYPTLGKKHFEEIIRRELNRIFGGWDSNSIVYDDLFEKLVYSESVYPAQGVRPIFTSIETIASLVFSEILLENTNESVKITLKDPDDWNERRLKMPSTVIKLEFGDGSVREFSMKLVLGELRDPSKNTESVQISIHEAGHAIVQYYTSGTLPNVIVSTSAGRGGFTDTFSKKREGQVNSFKGLKNRIMTLVAGYEAEHLIFPADLCLLGSGDDLDKAWDSWAEAYYRLGAKDPIVRESFRVTTKPGSGIPHGLEDDDGFRREMESSYRELRRKAHCILIDEIELLIATGKELSTKGSLVKEEFVRLVNQYGKGAAPNEIEDVTKYLTTAHIED